MVNAHPARACVLLLVLCSFSNIVLYIYWRAFACILFMSCIMLLYTYILLTIYIPPNMYASKCAAGMCEFVLACSLLSIIFCAYDALLLHHHDAYLCYVVTCTFSYRYIRMNIWSTRCTRTYRCGYSVGMRRRRRSYTYYIPS